MLRHLRHPPQNLGIFKMAKRLIQATRQQDKVLLLSSHHLQRLKSGWRRDRVGGSLRFVVVAVGLIPRAAFLQSTRASPKSRKKFEATTEVRRSYRTKTTPVSYKDAVSYLLASILSWCCGLIRFSFFLLSSLLLQLLYSFEGGYIVLGSCFCHSSI